MKHTERLRAEADRLEHLERMFSEKVGRPIVAEEGGWQRERISFCDDVGATYANVYHFELMDDKAIEYIEDYEKDRLETIEEEHR